MAWLASHGVEVAGPLAEHFDVLKSFLRPFIILSVMPLGLIGVVAGLLVSGKPLGFVAILGILSLLGMIAKNAVILLDQIETEGFGWVAIWRPAETFLYGWLPYVGGLVAPERHNRVGKVAKQGPATDGAVARPEGGYSAAAFPDSSSATHRVGGFSAQR